jgi:hypothetical protein
MHFSLISMKKASLMLGVASIGLLSALPLGLSAKAQSTVPEFELSKEGYEILCERSPLNSRCQGSQSNSGTSGGGMMNDRVPTGDAMNSPNGTTAPTQTLPSEGTTPYPTTEPSGRPSSQDGSGGSGSNMNSPSGSGSSQNDPSGTTAPTQTLPSEGTTPSPTTEPSGRPSSQDGSGSDMNNPAGTTAPTQTLPSEGTTPSPSR